MSRGYSQTDNLFTTNHLDQTISNSIDGATALKLDESFEIKNNEAQNNLMDDFEKNEENQIAEASLANSIYKEEIPSGVSMESASYMENNAEIKKENTTELIKNTEKNNVEEEYTPKLFSEEQNFTESDPAEESSVEDTNQLFDEDVNEDEDFEIPAFLRRQKF